MRRLLLISFLLFCNSVVAQKSTVFYHLDKITVKKKVIKDSTNLNRYTDKVLEQFKLNGYVGISLKDSLVKTNGTHYYYEAAKQFDKIILHRQSEKKRAQKTFRQKDFYAAVSSIEKELTDLENNGFPFAKINFKHQEEDKNKLILHYEIDSGDFFIIDKIHIKSESKFHEKTVLNLIGVNVGDKYNESKIATIQNLLSASGLFKLMRPVEILFRKGRAELYLYLEKQKSSSADGYIGFQQDQITNRLALNGYIDLHLKNALNRAETILMHWKSNPDKTQNLTANLEYPFLFNTPLGTLGTLDLRKQDSTFLRTDITLGISYYHPIFRFKIFDEIESSSTLRESAPSEYRNYNKNTLGASIDFIAPRLNSLPFYHPRVHLLGGFFNYRNDTIDDNKRKINNSKYEFGYSHRIDFLKFFHLNNEVRYQGLTSDISLSRNEMIYFGGLQSVRGFYELELFGKDVIMFRNELEFKPINLFSIFLLYDRAAFHNSAFHQTNSFGVGFNLQAGSSALEIVIANGVLDQNSFDFSNTKIHIGFKSSF